MLHSVFIASFITKLIIIQGILNTLQYARIALSLAFVIYIRMCVFRYSHPCVN